MKPAEQAASEAVAEPAPQPRRDCWMCNGHRGWLDASTDEHLWQWCDVCDGTGRIDGVPRGTRPGSRP